MASRRRTSLLSRIDRGTAAIAVLCVAGVVLFSILVPIQTVLAGTPLAMSFLLGAAICGAPLLAVTRVRTAITLFCIAAFVLPLWVDPARATESPWPWSVPALLAFALLVGVVAFVHGPRRAAVPFVLGTVASLTAPLLRPEIVATPATAGSATADLIVTASVAAAVFLISVLLAGRLRVDEELTREREHSALEESRRALVEERTRIARELHDVIAHSMSVIQVQSSTARYRLSGLDEQTIAEFDSIAATARSSLMEMRRMLGVLRTEDHAAELAPQQGIADLPALVDSIRRAGADIALSIDAGDATLTASPATQIAAYRIVQEGLSNAVRHAPGAAIRVQVEAGATALRIGLRNDMTVDASPGHSSGYGLRGMRERAEILGGSLTAGPSPDGEWAVDAVLPVSPAFDTPDRPQGKETT